MLLVTCKQGLIDHSVFVRFPSKDKEPDRWNVWWKVSRRQEPPSKNALLCSAHFHDDMIDSTGQTRRLRPGAVPSPELVTIPEHLKVRSKSFLL